MTGVQIVTTSHSGWLTARRQGITASEIAVVLGLSPWSSPYELYHRKTGQLPEHADNAAMSLGRYLEGYVVSQFESRTGLFTYGNGRDLYAHPGRSWQMATPDRFAYDTDPGPGTPGASPLAVLEAKTSATYEGWGDDGSDQIPVAYRCQVLWQCDTVGTDHWFLACLFLHSRHLRVYEGVIDAQALADLDLMRHEAVAFLDRVTLRQPPAPDWTPATGRALRRLHPDLEDRDVTIPWGMARAYRAACAQLRTAEHRKQLMENRIRERLGNGRRVLDRDGQPVATRQVYEQREHSRRACTIDKLVPAPSPEEDPS